MENPRALLNFRSQMPAGIGNGHDVVGRYFCDRPTVYTSNLLLADVGAHAGADGKEPHDAVFTPPYTLVPEPAADAWPRVLERAVRRDGTGRRP